MATILIVEDDKSARILLSTVLKEEKYQVFETSSAEQALLIIENKNIDIIISDVQLPNMNGIELFKNTIETYPEMIFIIVTAYGTIEMAVETIKMGAYDFLSKPFNMDDIKVTIRNAIKQRKLKNRNVSLQETVNQYYGNIIGNSSFIKKLHKNINSIAKVDSSILIMGESGTGKELVARNIHRLSNRNEAPFLPVSCAAIPDNLLESELFGHEKGAYTGAEDIKKGKFELANDGTLFLDEIGDMKLELQMKLLRVIESQRFERLGGNVELQTNVRIIAATNKNLKEFVKQKKFRSDLYFRLNVIPLNLVPLRERKTDIMELFNHFSKKYAYEYKKDILNLTSDAKEVFVNYTWPGNVRQMKNIIERMYILSDNNKIDVSDLPEELIQNKSVKDIKYNIKRMSKDATLAEIEQKIILDRYNLYNENKTHTADSLGISLRTLHNKFRKYKKQGLL